MTTKTKVVVAPRKPDVAGQRLMVLAIDSVFEPSLPAREGMDERAMAELKDSMHSLGLLSPIIVFPRDGGYEVVAGHRRLLAARDLGWKSIPALVHPEAWEAKEAAMIHENVVRESLNPAEEAVFFAQLIEAHHLDEDGLCRMVKKSPEYIADRMRLLRGDGQVFQALRVGRVSLAVARELNKFQDDELRAYHLDAAIRSGCSSRVVASWLAEAKIHAAPVSAPGQVVSEGTLVEPSPQFIDACFFCGGAKDPYNLVTVRIHKWELEEIQRRLAAAVPGA